MKGGGGGYGERDRFGTKLLFHYSRHGGERMTVGVLPGWKKRIDIFLLVDLNII
jgi:hypothetical protein